MKKLLLVILLLTTNAFATGKLIVQGNRNLQTATYEKYSMPLVGLAVYEPIVKGFMAYNSFLGYGKQDFVDSLSKEDTKYFVTKQDVDFIVKRVTLSVGATIRYVQPYKEFNNDLHAKVSLKLWD